ncbi:FAD-dependent oxidoreductase, partial [Algoriphagus aestuarii]|nr:FAD-dependent oxidoreductase [Algoriphagus aestuarii]
GAGRRVTVFEREEYPGGRAGQLDLDGFHIDTGPTVLTMPDLLDEALAAVGESLSDRLDLVQLSPAYRAVFPDGSVLNVHTNADAMADEVARVCGSHDAKGYLRLRAWLRELYELE